MCQKWTVRKKIKVDGKYEIYLEIMYAGDKEVDDAGKMVAALKNVDGKRVWSFYSMNII